MTIQFVNYQGSYLQSLSNFFLVCMVEAERFIFRLAKLFKMCLFTKDFSDMWKIKKDKVYRNRLIFGNFAILIINLYLNKKIQLFKR